MTAQHGKSFGTAREKLPDNSYLIPQLQKIPGPGKVLHVLLSMTMRSKREKTIVSQLDPNPQTWLKTISHTRKVQGLELIQTLISTPKREDLLSQNTVIILTALSTPELKDLWESTEVTAVLLTAFLEGNLLKNKKILLHQCPLI